MTSEEGYPPSCPVFLWRGKIHEAVSLLTWFGIEMRDPTKEETSKYGWPWALSMEEVTPLTPMAKAMKAAVRRDYP